MPFYTRSKRCARVFQLDLQRETVCPIPKLENYGFMMDYNDAVDATFSFICNKVRYQTVHETKLGRPVLQFLIASDVHNNSFRATLRHPFQSILHKYLEEYGMTLLVRTIGDIAQLRLCSCISDTRQTKAAQCAKMLTGQTFFAVQTFDFRALVLSVK